MPKVSYINEPLDKLSIDDDIQSFVNDIFDSRLVYIMEQSIDKSLESADTHLIALVQFQLNMILPMVDVLAWIDSVSTQPT